MLIIQIETNNNADKEALERALEALLPQLKGVDEIAILDGEEYTVKKKIPVYTAEGLRKLMQERESPGGKI